MHAWPETFMRSHCLSGVFVDLPTFSSWKSRWDDDSSKLSWVISYLLSSTLVSDLLRRALEYIFFCKILNSSLLYFSFLILLSVINSSVLGPAIDANGGLEYLNLSWNHLRGKGGIAIGKGLRANCSLQILDLSWNGFADEGAAAVGESLKENNTLIDLDLSNNRISTEGALALSKGLQINNTLKILRLE